ncbi:CapA family protein [Acidobacteriota bacterium]
MEKTVRIKEEEKELSFLFMGDFCPIGGIEEVCRSGEAKDVDRIFEEFKVELKDKDLSIANLECPLTTSEKTIFKDGPHIKADPVAVRMAKDCEMDVLSLGNNHILDFGEEGLLETIRTLEDNGFAHLGAGRNVEEARKPLIREIKGIRAAFLSFCETEFNIGSETEAGCAPIEIHEISTAIRKAKERERADIVIVLLHSGSEHYPLPSPRVKKQCRNIADSGAAAVICHHTHTSEGFEIYNNVPIFYGLGNFIFGIYKTQRRVPKGRDGIMARIDFNRKGAVELKVIPYSYRAPESVLVKMDKDQLNSFWNRYDLLNEIVRDEDKLGRVWRQYSLRRYKAWYSPSLKKARLYFWKNRAWRNMILWHNRTNESHNDVIMTALNELKKGKSTVDREAKELLDELIGRETNIMKIKRLIRAWI